MTAQLYDRFYYRDATFKDGTTEFHELCRSYIHCGSRILEIGAGPTNVTSESLAAIGPVVGVDISNEVLNNTALSEAYVYNGRKLPFQDRSFDACVSNYVLEHIADPALHFAEVARVLRPGGHYCFRTPNRWHYVAFGARLTPHSLHVRLANRLRRLSEDAHLPYPTRYRANSRRAIQEFCAAVRLEIKELRMIEKEPSYGRFHTIAFLVMLLYERCVNRYALFAGLRANIFGVVRAT